MNKNKYVKQVVEWGAALLIAIVTVFLVTTFVARTAVVYGESMEPTLNHNDKVLIVPIAYIFSAPKRDDIIAFPFRGDPSRHFVKRVVGLPGDVIDLRNGNLYLNDEPYADDFFDGIWTAGNIIYPLTVPNAQYFVLGDNRHRSEDSRYSEVGCIELGEIDGKVAVRVWPLAKFGGIGK